MRTLFLFLCLLPWTARALPLPYLDEATACVPPGDADRYVKDFGIDLAGFGGRELCDSGSDAKKLLSDLALVEHSRFKADSSHPFLQGIIPADHYYDWMSSSTIAMDRGHDEPTASAYNAHGIFTMQDGWALLSSLGRVGTITHEARHSAREGFLHVECESGPYFHSGLSGCDESLAEKGSYAVELEYYTRAALDAQNLSPVYQSLARLMALGRASTMFNKRPLRQRQALVGLAGDKVVVLDQGRLLERSAPKTDSPYRLKRTSAGASLVSGRTAWALDLYRADDPGALSDDSSYFKLLKSSKQNSPMNFSDAEEWDSGDQRYFAELEPEGVVTLYNFATGVWSAPSPRLAGAGAYAMISPSGKSGLFALCADGTIVPFEPDLQRYGNPLDEHWPVTAAGFAWLGDELVELTTGGSAVDAKTGQAVPELAPFRFTGLVNAPLYDAYEVDP